MPSLQLRKLQTRCEHLHKDKPEHRGTRPDIRFYAFPGYMRSETVLRLILRNRNRWGLNEGSPVTLRPSRSATNWAHEPWDWRDRVELRDHGEAMNESDGTNEAEAAWPVPVHASLSIGKDLAGPKHRMCSPPRPSPVAEFLPEINLSNAEYCTRIRRTWGRKLNQS